MINLNIYVIHSSTLKEREQNIDNLKELANSQNFFNISFTTVCDHEASSIQMKNIKNLIKLGKLEEGENEFYNQFTKQLSLEVISNNFNHFKALQHISKNNLDDFNLVVEDDIQYSIKIYNQLNSLISKLENNEYDFVFLGQPSTNKENKDDSLSLEAIEQKDLLLTCIESFLISTRCAKSLLTSFFPIRYAQNIQLSYLISKSNLKAFKIFPNICGDGSKMGYFTSSVSANNVQIFNDIYKRVYLLLNDENFNEESIEKIKTLLSENTHKDNPDFMHLEALLYKKTKEYNKSAEIFEKTYEKYVENHCVLNNSSIFLRNYIDLYRYLQ
jgi:hypothetical protein